MSQLEALKCAKMDLIKILISKSYTSEKDFKKVFSNIENLISEAKTTKTPVVENIEDIDAAISALRKRR